MDYLYDFLNNNLSYDDWLDKTQNISNILVQEKNFLSKKDINFLLNYYNNNKSKIDFEGDLILPDSISNKYFDKLIKIGRKNGLTNIVKDFMIISNTSNNTYIYKHYDNCKLTKNGKIIKNHTPFRIFTTTVSLTKDFKGGNLFITKDRNDNNFVKINEELGEGICFTSNIDHYHYVSRLKKGNRIRLLIWLKYKPNLLNFKFCLCILILLIIIYLLFNFIYFRYFKIK